MTPLFVIVGMEKIGTTCPTNKHHNAQNYKSENANSSVGRNLEVCLGHLRQLLRGGISNVMQDSPTYLRLYLDVNVVQSATAMILTLTIEQHRLIHHFHGRDLILIREMIAKEIK